MYPDYLDTEESALDAVCLALGAGVALVCDERACLDVVTYSHADDDRNDDRDTY